MKMNSAHFASMLISLILFMRSVEICNAGELELNFYKDKCPLAETIVKNMTWDAVAANPNLPAKLLRLHFHDCFVRGCDASILLDPTPNNNSTEKVAPPNGSIAGFEVIDAIKEKLETVCNQTVSCADIIALSARDAVAFQFNQSMWEVLTGREDGKVSIAAEALANLPRPTANFSTLLSQFQSVGLNVSDLVALSGAHTIGITHCNVIASRLYNFTGNGDTDPDLDPDYAAQLKSICPLPIDSSTLVDMDPGSSTTFDSHYFVALNQRQGIFQSDAALLNNTVSAQIAKTFQSPQVFFLQFAISMKKMGAIGVLTNGQGEIRKNCRFVN